MNKKQFKANVAYLKKNGVELCGQCLWEGFPFSAELECYTKAGGDMIFDVDVLNREKLSQYIDEFNINKEVVLWWPNGEKGNGVPFSNIKEHYEDLEEWVESMKEIINGMPY